MKWQWKESLILFKSHSLNISWNGLPEPQYRQHCCSISLSKYHSMIIKIDKLLSCPKLVPLKNYTSMWPVKIKNCFCLSFISYSKSFPLKIRFNSHLTPTLCKIPTKNKKYSNFIFLTNLWTFKGGFPEEKNDEGSFLKPSIKTIFLYSPQENIFY